MTKVLISGGSGLIGKQLSFLLTTKNYAVNILSRNPTNSNEYKWDIKQGYIDEKAFENIDYIIHLAGAGIADKRWTSERKQEIIDSRVMSTELLLLKVSELKIPLKGFISASGIGYYGAITSEHIFNESDTANNDFIGNVCQLWEDAALKFDLANIRTTILRTGIVLSKKGGALAKMKTPIISPIGSAKQYLPWIHIDDICEMYLYSIENPKMKGIYNAVAPEHHTSSSFSKALAKALKRIYIGLPVPGFLLKLLFGELAIILLKGSRVSSKKISQHGYNFKFSKLKDALKDVT
ncbi:MAG: TIGR01777 family oxidoreductase [Flavobacteriaceae bacterium]